MEDNFNLNRFVEAQKNAYNTALFEIKKEKKRAIGCGIFFLNIMVWEKAICL